MHACTRWKQPFHARNGQNRASATSRCLSGRSDRRGHESGGGMFRFLRGGCFCEGGSQKKTHKTACSDGDREVLNIPTAAAAVAARSLWLCLFRSIYNRSEEHFKAQRPHRKKIKSRRHWWHNQAAEWKYREGGSSAGWDYTTRPQLGPVPDTGGSLLYPNMTTTTLGQTALSFFERITL